MTRPRPRRTKKVRDPPHRDRWRVPVRRRSSSGWRTTMIKKYAAAALLSAAVAAGAGAATIQETATAEDSTHTLRLKLHVTAGRSLDQLHFVGTERVRSRDTHEFVGFDTFRGRIKEDTVVF